MNIHEYQAKAVLAKFGVPVAHGLPAFSAEEAVKAAKELGGPVWVVKAQIHAGGRGKAGGVKVVKSIEDVEKEATRLIGSILVQTQYYMLDGATAKLFGLATDLTEVFVVSVLEREIDG